MAASDGIGRQGASIATSARRMGKQRLDIHAHSVIPACGLLLPFCTSHPFSLSSLSFPFSLSLPPSSRLRDPLEVTSRRNGLGASSRSFHSNFLPLIGFSFSRFVGVCGRGEEGRGGERGKDGVTFFYSGARCQQSGISPGL